MAAKAEAHIATIAVGCSQTNVVPCIEYAAAVYHQDASVAVCVAKAESGLDPYNPNNPTHYGLWQFDSGTWSGTPYAAHPITDAYWSSLGAMWYWSLGQYARWTTYGGCA